MILYSSLAEFVNIANEFQLIQPLLPFQECTVCFQYEEECYTLHISKQGLFVSEAAAAHTLRIKYGQDIQRCFRGVIRLQTMLRQNGADFDGTFRMLLLLESLFFLCKQIDTYS